MITNINAIDKLRTIVNWADYQNEGFNQRIRTIEDIQKLYDYAQANDLEFLDEPYQWGEGEQKHIKAINKLLGYKIY